MINKLVKQRNVLISAYQNSRSSQAEKEVRPPRRTLLSTRTRPTTPSRTTTTATMKRRTRRQTPDRRGTTSTSSSCASSTSRRKCRTVFCRSDFILSEKSYPVHLNKKAIVTTMYRHKCAYIPGEHHSVHAIFGN